MLTLLLVSLVLAGPNGGGKSRRGSNSAASQRSSSSENPAPTATVKNPASGADLAVYVSKPSGPGPFPAVVIVPGGQQGAWGGTLSGGGERRFTSIGVAVVRFDADGRGASTGTPDYSGPLQQAGLRAVIDWAASQPDISPERVGVVSYSAGLLMAAPALVGGPNKARFLLDWEGPPSKDFLRGCKAGGSGIDFKHDCNDTAWWAERDALVALPKLKVPYWRVQSVVDHHGGTDTTHVESAIAAAAGGTAPWVRLNDLPQAYGSYPKETLLGGLAPDYDGGERDAAITAHVKELFGL